MELIFDYGSFETRLHSFLPSTLVVSSGETLSWEDLLLSSMRTLNGVAVATCARNAAEITCMQGLHGGRDHEFQDQPGICSYQLDTAGTRKKYFNYSIDYDLLLKTTTSR